MRTYLLFFVVLIAVFSLNSCLNTSDTDFQSSIEELNAYQNEIYKQYQADSILIVDYFVLNDSIAEIDSSSGIFYHIIQTGNDNYPNYYSTINVKYKGMLLDGTVFDQSEDEVLFSMANLITGWQIGLPLIGENGKIILYLPSYYGFGTVTNGDIPANSVLIFEIELISFI
jgi:FKBP-type peptidyl-prolyl cis-trans isomerase